MYCPKCRDIYLKRRRVEESMVDLDYCPQCMGVWFDNRELQYLLPTAVEQLKMPRNAVRLKILCPKCDKPLYAFHYPDTTVTIEVCKKCMGLWLDCAEFQQIRIEREHTACEEPEENGSKTFLARVIEILRMGFEKDENNWLL
ncbi:MAG: hypothetical protein E4H40_01085 [Candidatus Brocadiia bacterium]|nr:MAG: hypothetical protein E4H40_01085 [Candidatus Brocadiia bacterium]